MKLLTENSEQGNPALLVTDWVKSIDELRVLLPIQNPLHSFVHNNMLIAWEKHEFWKGAFQAARLYGAAFPKSLEFYQKEWTKGRITDLTIQRSIQATHPTLSQEEITFLTKLLKSAKDFAADPILRFMKLSSKGVDASQPQITLTEFSTREKLDQFFFPSDFGEWFCLLCESYLDQGVSSWPNPFQDVSLRQFAVQLLKSSSVKNSTWRRELLELLSSPFDSKALAVRECRRMGLKTETILSFVTETAFAFKGWVGLVNKLEREPEWFPFNHVTVQLEDALSILISTRRILKLAPREKENPKPPTVTVPTTVLDAFFGTDSISKHRNLISVLNALSPLKSAQLLHEAYETTFYNQTLSSIAAQVKDGIKSKPRADFGILLCMDDREESLRRHLEATSPKLKTYGVLGNFNIDMKFAAWDFPISRRQCPPVVNPRRTVIEKPVSRGAVWKLNYGKYRASRSKFNAWVFRSAGSPIRGWIASTIYGPVTAVVLFSRVLIPQTWAQLRGYFERKVFKRTSGEILLERTKNKEVGEVGYDLDEQAAIVASVLKPLGPPALLPLKMVALAHQASTYNNPFQQAYGCGACSGNSGSVNSRVFCLMANSPSVQALLVKNHGMQLPSGIRFIPAVHDTTTDTVEFLSEPDELEDQSSHLNEIQEIFATALGKNAKERVRFFENGPNNPTEKEALTHVQFRSLNLAEPRPEYGHNRVAMALFCRRELTEKIHLDRRSFLVSYDPQADDKEGTILKGLLYGALPVAANIGLDYFFSTIDPHGFGAGSKLPLNISALIGVVSGSRGDIRIGLANQMIEIHEPIRVLVIVEAEPGLLLNLLMGHPRIKKLLTNAWIHLVAISPTTHQFLLWTSEGWQPWNS